MKGLLLNQYFSVEKSFWMYLFGSILLVGALFMVGNTRIERVATFVPIVFMVSPALEVLKHESSSGWNKFALTLPLKRRQIVQSHYLFFVSSVLIGLVITMLLFSLVELMKGNVLTSSSVNSIMNAIGIGLIMGAVAYPLTYMLGTEKSDTVLITAVFSSIGLLLLGGFIFGILLETIPLTFLQQGNPDVLFSAGYLLMGIVIYLVSYFWAINIYKQKEY